MEKMAGASVISAVGANKRTENRPTQSSFLGVRYGLGKYFVYFKFIVKYLCAIFVGCRMMKAHLGPKPEKKITEAV